MASHIFWQLHIIIVVYMKGETKMFERKKYKLLKNDTIEYDGHTLYRIKYLKDFTDCRCVTIRKGTLGGYVENYDILDQSDNSSILGKSIVYGRSRVARSSIVGGESIVGYSTIGSSYIGLGSTIIGGDIKNCKVVESTIHNSHVYECTISDCSKVYGAFVKKCRIFGAMIDSTKYHKYDKVEDIDANGFPYNYYRKDIFENALFFKCNISSNDEYISIDAYMYFEHLTIFKTNDSSKGKYGINFICLDGYCHTKSICDFEDMCHKEFEDAADAIIKTVKDCISIMELHAHKESIKNVDNYIRDAIISAASLNIDDTRKFLNTILYKAKDLLDTYDKMIKEGIKDAKEC